MNPNPYFILNLSQDASYQQIKQSYFHLSRNLHPDKQPIENYHMAKLHFQSIDKAYKSIYTPLLWAQRYYTFILYGIGITLIDQYPLQFKFFDDELLDINDQSAQARIRHLVLYMLHEDHAMNQIDKSKLTTKSVLNLNKIFKYKPYLSSILKVPDIEKNSFAYEMPLPDFYGFSNSFAIGSEAGGFDKSAGSSIDFNFSTMKRVRNNILANAQASLGNQANTFELSADWIINNSAQIRFSPISFVNSDLQLPKIGFDKAFKNFSFSGITDFRQVNIDVSKINSQREEINKRSSWSVKLMMEKNALMVIPKYEYEITKEVKLMTQLFVGIQEQTSLSYSFNYGYQFKLSDQYKLELLSFTGGQNYFQLSLYSPKFRVNLPMFSDGDFIRMQLYKIFAALFTLAAIKTYRAIEIRSKMKRKRVIHQEYNRLSEEKNLINKTLNQISALSEQRHLKQLKYNGLVIVKAFIGSSKKLTYIKKEILTLLSHKINGDTVSEIYNQVTVLFSEKLNQANIKYGQLQDEVHEITNLFRSYVKGGQIINKKMPSFYPLINEKSVPYVIVLYLNRGQLGFYFESSEKRINIGGVMESKASAIKRVQNWFINWIW